MHKSLIHIALVFNLLLSGMSYSVIQTHFYMNRAQIAAAFCENKDLPELACNGSCELGRRLSDAKEKESEKEKMFLEEILLHYILTEPQMLEPVCYSIASLVYASPRVSLATFEIGLDFFHPPRRA